MTLFKMTTDAFSNSGAIVKVIGLRGEFHGPSCECYGEYTTILFVCQDVATGEVMKDVYGDEFEIAGGS